MSNHELLKPENCCLHIIDPQKSLMTQIHESDRVIKVIRLMIECARILDIPILANTQYLKGLGPYVAELEDMMDGVARCDKTEFSAYANKETCEIVDSLADGLTTAILVGVETHICIYQSAMGALQKGITPWIVADAVSSRSLINHELGLERLRGVGAIVGPAEMLIYELLAQSGTAEFKQVLPHIIAFNKEME